MLPWGGIGRGERSPRPAGLRRGGGIFASAIPIFFLLQAPGPGRLPNRIGGLPGDSVSLRRPPLPGGVADVVRQIFDAPQGLQIVVGILAVFFLLGLVTIAWWQRAELLAWFTVRSRRTLLLAGIAGFAVLGVVAWFSVRSWNYMQHDNAFCSGCHVMAPAWQKFQTTKHATLSCHQCHQQSLFASARQLVLWVADRPGKIPTHSKVPNERCIACHVQGDSARWRQIAATEGHRLHLESPRLPGLQCVRCHGFSVHQFVPTDMTCGQAGCHVNIRIRLGKMSNVTALHCAMCHVFTRRAAAPTSVTDSLRRWLTPTRVECFGCHAMRKLMVDQQLAHDPHGAVCGACHNPHTQTEAVQAERSCTNAGCHAHPETLTSAHRGLPAPALASCVSCHRPHSWKTAGKGDCSLCHGTMFTPGSGGKTAAMPWGRLYTRLVASMSTARARTWSTVRRDARWRAPQLASDTPPARPRPVPPAKPSAPAPPGGAVPAPFAAPRAGTVTTGPFRGFSHGIHRQVACTSCHSMSSSHGTLLMHSFEDCMRCHHAPSQHIACTRCHAVGALPQNVQRGVTVSTSVASAPSTRTLPFSHAAHPDVACLSCHSGPPTYDTLASCTSCHESHHTTARDCRVCHVRPVIAQHSAVAHVTCAGAGCHRDAAVDTLSWSRQVCLACHRDRASHYPAAECDRCHAVPALQRAAPARTGG